MFATLTKIDRCIDLKPCWVNDVCYNNDYVIVNIGVGKKASDSAVWNITL